MSPVLGAWPDSWQGRQELERGWGGGGQTTWDPCTLPRSAPHWSLPAACSPSFPCPPFLSLQGEQPQALSSCPHLCRTLLDGGGLAGRILILGSSGLRENCPVWGPGCGGGARGWSVSLARLACGWGAVQQGCAEVCSFRSGRGRLRQAVCPQTSAAVGRARCLAGSCTCVPSRPWDCFCADKRQEVEAAWVLDGLSGGSQGRPQPPSPPLPAEGAGGQVSWGCH